MDFCLPIQTFFGVETRQSGELCFAPIYSKAIYKERIPAWTRTKNIIDFPT